MMRPRDQNGYSSRSLSSSARSDGSRASASKSAINASPMDDLRALLDAQHDAHLERRTAGHVVPWVFFRMVAQGRGGKKADRVVFSTPMPCPSIDCPRG
jgi:hypothetical protein